MGRRGGYGNAGYFADNMELNIWYTVSDVYEFFRHKSETVSGVDSITVTQAKTIIDALHKAKCYVTHKRADKFAILLVERINHGDDEPETPPELIQAASTIRKHLTRCLINMEWSQMPKQIEFKLKRRDKRVKEIGLASQERRPIVINGVNHSLKGWDNETGGLVRLMFQPISEPELIEFNSPEYVFVVSDLS